MNEDLKNKANEVLLQLLKKATEVGEAAVAEIPLVVQELLVWKFAASLASFLLCLFVAIAAWYGVYRFFKWGLSKDERGRSNIYNNNFEPFVVLAPFFSLCLTPWFLLCHNWIKIWLAPRVYLLEYAASLVR